jgi:hypothetical protein
MCFGIAPVNVEDFHFPKRGPARPKVYKAKSHVNRYRNYKQHPNYTSTHAMVRICRQLSCVCIGDDERGFQHACIHDEIHADA